MRTTASRWLLVLVACAAIFVPSARASADTFDDLVWLLNQLDSAGANPFPVSGNMLADSKDLLECLADEGGTDTGIAACIAKTEDSALASEIPGVGSIPSWFYDLIDLYLAIRNDDFWGVVENVGEAGLCIVAQMMAGGALDVCDLIGDLVAVAEGLLDAGVAFAEFVGAFGENVAEAIVCIFADCDSEGSPPEQVAYAFVFQPRIAEGVQAREKVDYSAFDKFRAVLEINAAACPMNLGPPKPVTTCSGASPAKIASDVWTGVVDAGWSADVAAKVLPDLAQKRDAYDTKARVAILANLAANKYLVSATPPGGYVVNRCSGDFSTGLGFAHVDRWIMTHEAKAAELGQLKTSLQWCDETFWKKNQAEFALRFRDFAKAKLCTGASPSQSLVCDQLAGYEKCLGLMDSVGKKALCTANVATVGMEAAKKIEKYFKDHGSKVPCQIPTPPPGAKSVDFVCGRPSQRAACESTYASLYGKAPQKLVTCKLNLDMEPSYKQLMAKVPPEAKKLAGPNKVAFAIDTIDPLVVRVSESSIKVLEADPHKNQGFGPPSPKPGFDFLYGVPRPIDGVSTPAFASELKPKLAMQNEPLTLQEAVQNVHPSDPDPTQRVGKPGEVSQRAKAAAPGALPRLWSAATPEKGGSARSAAAAAALPDLTVAPSVRVGATSGRWGQSLSVPAVQSRRKLRGLCEFELRYETQNAGAGAASPSSRSLRNRGDARAASARSAAIPAGGRQEVVEVVLLKPGTNELRVSLDEANQLAEAQEGNNQFDLRVEVTGTCDSTQSPVRAQPGSPETRAPQQQGR